MLTVGRTMKPSKQSRPAETPEAGHTSKTGQASEVETNGVAFLDTGASRSVIGD